MASIFAQPFIWQPLRGISGFNGPRLALFFIRRNNKNPRRERGGHRKENENHSGGRCQLGGSSVGFA